MFGSSEENSYLCTRKKGKVPIMRQKVTIMRRKKYRSLRQHGARSSVG